MSAEDEEAIAARRRALIDNFMHLRGLAVASWTRAAGVSSSALYNFLNGSSRSLSQGTIEKLARAAGVPVSVLAGDSRAGADNSVLSGALVSMVISDEYAPLDPKDREHEYLLTVPVDYGIHWSLVGYRVSGHSLNLIYPAKSIVFGVLQGNFGRPSAPGDLVIATWARESGERHLIAGHYRLDRDGRPWLWRPSDQPQFQRPVPIDTTLTPGSPFAGGTIEVRSIIIGGFRREEYASPSTDISS